MASRQSVSSILKPPKVRAPLKEIESIDQDDEDTATLPKRKVSFSGMNKIKMYNTGATSLTVHQAPMFDEQISMLSDTSNGERTKLSGKFEKSDGQITLESTNCTNMEENGRVIIEYNSPNDNMEMTEAFSGKIFSDTIYTIDNNGSEHIDSSLDYSTNNMEFTEVIGQILTADLSNSSSIEMSETLSDENEQPTIQLGRNSMPLQNSFVNKVSNADSYTTNLSCMNNQSSNMDLTSMSLIPLKSICFDDENEKSMIQSDHNSLMPLQDIFVDKISHVNSPSSKLSCINKQSSYMELTSMSLIPQKSICFNDENEKPMIQSDHNSLKPLQDILVDKISHVGSFSTNLSCINSQSSNMELTSLSLLPQKSICFDNSKTHDVVELMEPSDEQMLENNYEYDQNNIIMESEITHKVNRNCINKISQNNILYAESTDINTFSNDQVINPEFKSINDEDVEKLSLSVVSMDIDPTLDGNDSNISFINIDDPELVAINQKKLTQPLTSNIYDKSDLQDNYSGAMDITKNIASCRVSMVPTSSSFVQETSPEKKINTSVTVEEQNLKEILNAHTSKIDQCHSIKKNRSMEVEKNPKKYSRKSIMLSMFDQVQSEENENNSNSSIIAEKQYPRYSRKSIVPSSGFNKAQSEGNANDSNTSVIEKNVQQICSKHLVELSEDFDQTQSIENKDDTNASAVVEDNELKNSRKSVELSMNYDETHSMENEDDPNVSAVVEDNQQNRYSRKSIVLPSVFDQTQSKENNTSDASAIIENNFYRKYSRKSIVPSSISYETQSTENESDSNISAINESNLLQNCSRKSELSADFDQNLSMKDEMENENDLNTSNVVEEKLHKVYSRKSVAPSSAFDQTQSMEDVNVSDTSRIIEDNQQKLYFRKSNTPSNFDQICFNENEDYSHKYNVVEENVQKVFTRKSVEPKASFDEIEDNSKTSAVVEENVQKVCSGKSSAPTIVFDQTQLKTDSDFFYTSEIVEGDQSIEKGIDSEMVVEENERKKYSRKTMGPTSSIFTLNKSLKDCSFSSDNSSIVKESDKSSTSMISGINKNNSLVSNHSNLSNYEQKLLLKNEHQSVLSNVICDDELNSPLKKKSRKSVALFHCTENILKVIDENNISENIEFESKMNISFEVEPIPCSKTNISSEETSMTMSTSSPLCNTSLIGKIPNSLVDKNKNSSSLIAHDLLKEREESFSNENSFSKLNDTSKQTEELIENNMHDNLFEEKIHVSHDQLKENELSFSKLDNDFEKLKEQEKNIPEIINNDIFTVANNEGTTKNVLDSRDLSTRCQMDKITNEVCIEDLSNLVLSDEPNKKCDKSFISNVPLSCSSFMFKPNINNCLPEDFIKEEFMKESPIKKEITNKNLTITEFIIDKDNEVDIVEKECVKENLSIEVLEFLEKWRTQFIKKKLDLDKCTNCEWVFNILDNHIKLIIKYSPISNDHSYLKVKDILFITNIITENEIIKFGINWILSKYSPKFYKEICFTSKDVELLLKSLLEDVQFITAMMKNMMFIKEIYFVEFKDNKAEFVLHSMETLTMARIEVMLTNVHKLSIKDITVDCLFGFFNTNMLNEVVESLPKDCKVLQSLVEKCELILSPLK